MMIKGKIECSLDPYDASKFWYMRTIDQIQYDGAEIDYTNPRPYGLLGYDQKIVDMVQSAFDRNMLCWFETIKATIKVGGKPVVRFIGPVSCMDLIKEYNND